MLDDIRFCAFGSTWRPSYDRFLLSDDRYKPTPVEIIRMAGQVDGLDGVELVYPQQLSFDTVDEVKSALNEAGLEIPAVPVSISSKREYRGGALTADDPAVRQQAIETVQQGMDIAAELNSDQIFLWLGRDGFDYPFQINYDLYWNRLVDALEEIAAHRPDIRIGLNYKLREPRKWLLLSTAAKTLLLIEEVGAPNLGAILDSGHALMAYENLGETVALLSRRGKLFHTHINDNTRLWDDDMVVGSVHFMETLEMLYWLYVVEYEGWISFNPHAQLEDPTRLFEESIRYIRGMISVMEACGPEAIEKSISTHQVTETLTLVWEQIFR
ncbi:MAG: sugar phosphate isomerase/epimerase [Anaerolineales bacterium]|jgi:sugar phosphate isomerase/epimerase